MSSPDNILVQKIHLVVKMLLMAPRMVLYGRLEQVVGIWKRIKIMMVAQNLFYWYKRTELIKEEWKDIFGKW